MAALDELLTPVPNALDDLLKPTPERAALDKTSPSFADYARGLASGVNNIITTAGEGLNLLGAEKIGKAVREFGQSGEQYWQEAMTPAGKEAAGGDLENRPLSTIGMAAAQSLPGMAAMFVPGLGATKALQATNMVRPVFGALKDVGVGARRAATIARAAPVAVGMGASEGVYSGLSNAAQAAQEIAQVPIEQLSQTPAYRAIEESNPNLVPEEIRNLLSAEAERQVALRTAPWTGAVGALTGGGILGQIAQKATGGVAKNIVKGAAKEAGQEIPQSGGEQYIQNVVAGETYDPSRPATRDVAKQAIIGGGAGGLLGGLGGGVHALTGPQFTPHEELLNKTAETVIATRNAETKLTTEAANDRQKPGTAAGQKTKAPAAEEADAAGQAVLTGAIDEAALSSQPPVIDKPEPPIVNQPDKIKVVDAVPRYVDKWTSAHLVNSDTFEYDSRPFATEAEARADGGDVYPPLNSAQAISGETGGEKQAISGAGPAINPAVLAGNPPIIPDETPTPVQESSAFANREQPESRQNVGVNVSIAPESRPGLNGIVEPMRAEIVTDNGLLVVLDREFQGKYRITGADGAPIGAISYTLTADGTGFRVTGVDVKPEFQRKGVATAVYDYLEKNVIGASFEQSGGQSEAGAAFRAARNEKVIRKSPAVSENGPEGRSDNVGGAVLQAVFEARAIQAEFLADKGLTMDQARAMSKPDQAALQNEYSKWLQARQTAPGEALPGQAPTLPAKPVAPQEDAKAQPPAVNDGSKPSWMNQNVADALIKQGFDPADAPADRLPDSEMRKYPITKAVLEAEKEPQKIDPELAAAIAKLDAKMSPMAGLQFERGKTYKMQYKAPGQPGATTITGEYERDTGDYDKVKEKHAIFKSNGASIHVPRSAIALIEGAEKPAPAEPKLDTPTLETKTPPVLLQKSGVIPDTAQKSGPGSSGTPITATKQNLGTSQQVSTVLPESGTTIPKTGPIAPESAKNAQVERPVGKILGKDVRELSDANIVKFAKSKNKKVSDLAIREEAWRAAQSVTPERTVITPSEDVVIGKNAAGEQLYERPDGSVYRMQTGRPDFGGDLAVAEAAETKPAESPKPAAPGAEPTPVPPVSALAEKPMTPADHLEAAAKLMREAEKSAQPNAEPATPEPAPRQDSGGADITDFGEKIGGARKDYAETYRDRMKEAASMDIAAEPLSKSWPEPDYQKLLAEKADPWSVAFAHAARDEVPTKPQQSWKLSQWVKNVQLLRDTTNKIMAGELSTERARELLADSTALKPVSDRAELYTEVGHDKSLKGVRISSGTYGIFNREKFDPPKVIWSVERKTKTTAMSRWPEMLAHGATREEAIANFKNAWSATPAEQEAKAVEFDIYSRRGTSQFFIGKKIGKNVVTLKDGFTTAKEARAWKAANQAELVKTLEKIKEVPNERRESNSPRVGADHRTGADVTPAQFSETFGFRGVEFGNYVEGSRRQADLNEAYDALMDLAGVLGVPTKALSLNGELALAFGARGMGGRSAGGRAAAAHYEPGKVVINLTKEHGAGSLAHEWFHAVDNYFSRARGDKTGFVTGAPGARGEGMRPEMLGAFNRVMAAVRASGVRERSIKLDSARYNPYWGLSHEMAARSFESYVIAKLHDQSASNDYLANIVSQQYWDAAAALGMEKEGTYPYPADADMPAIRAAFDDFFKTVETRETDKGVEMYSQTDEPGPGLPAADIRAHIAGITEKLSVPVTVYDDVAAANSDGATLPNDAQGFASKGRIGLVAENIKTRLDAETTLFHELFHVGIRAVSKQAKDANAAFANYTAALNRVAMANPEVRRRAKAWRDKYAAEKAEQFRAAGIEDALDARVRLTSFDEAIADMAGERRGRPITRLNELIAALQRLVRALGFDELANWMENATSAETLSLIRSATQAVSKDTVTFGGELAGETMQSRLDQTQTAEFRKWFKQSKVSGIVYHSTGYDFTTFDLSDMLGAHFGTKQAALERGAKNGGNENKVTVDKEAGRFEVWADNELQGDYATEKEADAAAKKLRARQPIAAYLSIQNPLRLPDMGTWTFDGVRSYLHLHDVIDDKQADAAWEAWQRSNKDGWQSLRRILENEGYDGIVYQNDVEDAGSDSYIAFRPEQIKSAIGNRGTFSPGDPDIMHSRAGDALGRAIPQLARNRMAELTDYLIYNYQDRFHMLPRIQKRLHPGALPEGMDANLAVEAYPKVVAAKIQDFQDDYVKPFVKLLHDSNLTIEQAQEYANAKDAPDRNREMKARNPTEAELDALKADAAATRDALAGDENVKDYIAKRRELRQAEADVEDGLADQTLVDMTKAEIAALRKEKTVKDYAAAVDKIKALKSIKPFVGDNTELSGMGDARAAEVIAKSRQDGTSEALERVSASIDAITAKTRQILVENGLAKPEEVAAWEAAYPHYVPRFRDEVTEGTPHPVGQGLQVRGKESKRATGSTKEVTNILAHVMAAHEAAVIRAEKVKADRALFSFLAAHPDNDVAELDVDAKVRDVDAKTGLVVERVDWAYKNKANVLTLKIDGDEHTITFNEDNPEALRLAASMKNLSARDIGEITATIGKFTRFLATMNTAANPVFVARNFLRDSGTAFVNLSDTELADTKKRVFADIPKAIRGFWDMTRGNMNSEWAKSAREFRDAGGQIGFLQHYKDILARAETLEKQLSDTAPGKLNFTKEKAKSYWHLIEDANLAVENGVRLSAYVNARRNGMTQAKAISLASNLTVNFTKHGARGVELNMWYMFMNASIQGTARLIKALGNRNVQKILAYVMVSAFLLDMLNRGLAGDDDDDGENDYDQLPDYTKANNFVFYLGRPITIPMPYGYNFFASVGRTMSEAMFRKNFNAAKSAVNLASIFVDAFSPTGQSGSLLQFAAPTISDPFVQWAENKNFAGNPLRREQLPFGPPKPEYQMGFKSTSAPAKGFAEALNDWTGGNEARPGLINLNPAAFDFAVTALLGGAGRTYLQTVSLPVKTAMGEEIQAREVPFLNIVASAKPEYQIERKFYETVREVETTKEELKTYRGDPEMLREIRKDHAAEIRVIGMARGTQAILENIRKQERMLEKSKPEGWRERAKHLEERKRVLMSKFNKSYTEARQ